jgi:hypothetical protein
MTDATASYGLHNLAALRGHQHRVDLDPPGRRKKSLA